MAKPSPESLEEDIAAIKSSGIDSVICLLETEESKLLILQNEEAECLSRGLAFTRFPITDFGVPDASSLTTFIERTYHDISTGINTVIHCRGGIGRTGLICCCLLIKDRLDAKDAITLVSRQRGHQVPETTEQTNLVLNFKPA